MSATETSHVTRIKTAASSTKKTASTKQETAVSTARRSNPLTAIWHGIRAVGGYFKGAWRELREVRWPTRTQTWSMTGALVGFTAVFVVLILLLDALFKYLFELILK